MKVLPDIFYTMPRYANCTMNKVDLQELLLSTDGWIYTCGYTYDIKPKHISGGIYRVTLKRRKYNER